MEKGNELYERVLSLKNEYINATTGRREILKKMLDSIDKLRKCSKEHKNELEQMEMCYKLRNYYISDYKLVMNVILKLANQDNEKYGMKEIISSDFLKFNENSLKQVYGKALVITTKEILNQIDETKHFYYDEFSALASRILKSGCSLVIVTPNYFENNVKPKDLFANRIRHDLKNGGFMSNISCFLQDDELKEAVIKVDDYIDINGPDFQNIDEDTLYNLVIENNKQKVLSKRVK